MHDPQSLETHRPRIPVAKRETNAIQPNRHQACGRKRAEPKQFARYLPDPEPAKPAQSESGPHASGSLERRRDRIPHWERDKNEWRPGAGCFYACSGRLQPNRNPVFDGRNPQPMYYRKPIAMHQSVPEGAWRAKNRRTWRPGPIPQKFRPGGPARLWLPGHRRVAPGWVCPTPGMVVEPDR